MKKVFENFIYQSIYQVLLIILPIITIPIISDTLGPTGVGTFNYVYSITNYFILFIGLGLANYGVREIAQVRESKQKLSQKFWELQIFNFVISTAVLTLFFIITSYLKYSNYYLILSLAVFGYMLDITWFYSGIEEFKMITTANGIVKLIGFLLIVILIHDKSDLGKYILIQSSNILLSQLILWFFIRNKIFFIRVRLREVFAHFLPALSYFIGKLAVTLYTNLNKTLLGVLATITAVGYYTNSLQLVIIVVALMGSLDTVLMPKMSHLQANKKEDEMIELLTKVIHLEIFVTIPAMFGILATNQKLIGWFFGEKFSYIEKIVPFFAPLVIIIPLGTAIMRQYLIPMKQIKQYNFSVILGAFLGVVINILLIPQIGIWGAVIATLISELMVTGIRVSELMKKTTFRFSIHQILKYFVSGLVMLIIIELFSSSMRSSPVTTFIQMTVGLIVYMAATFILKANPIVDMIKFLRKKI